MARILIVHGIANDFIGEMELHVAWYPALCDGLLRAGHSSLPAPDDCFCPFYGDLFRPGDRLGGGRLTVDAVDEFSSDDTELLNAVWHAAASIDPRVPDPAEYGETLFRYPRIAERALTSLARSSFLADTIPLQFLGDLKQVVSYLNDPVVHNEVLGRVLVHITADTRLIVGHSLGSVVAYEALCAKPEHVTAFISLGSPLGIPNVVFDKLTPKPPNPGLGCWPGTVRWWTNIAARGDIVAAQKELAPFFGDRVEDVVIDSGWDAHSSTRYLNSIQAGRAVARALAVKIHRRNGANRSLMAQHLLIAAATSAYPNLSPQDARPQLAAVLQSVVRLFTDTIGVYRRELEVITSNPTADALRKSLDEWFASPNRDPSDWVVFYYTGHAEVVGDESLYLLTSDFQPHQYVGTAFSLQQFADIVLAPRGERKPRRVRNLLAIIDTCFAGEGAIDLASRLAKAFRRNTGSSFYVLGAALPRQEAQAGALTRALIEAIEALSKRHVMQRWLFLEQIVPAINQKLRVHDAIWSAVNAAREEPQFFPNPSFVDTAGAPVPADEAQRAIADQEFRDHWGPRARGVEFDAQPGSYFSGRETVLDKLATFLADETHGGTTIVTGRPGAGKSAILSRLLTLAMPEYDSAVGAVAARLHVPRVHLAIHAKGKRLGDLSSRVGRLVGADTNPEAILDRLAHADAVTRIVVDALDEATEPRTIAEQLLAPLGSLASVKLVVGTQETHVHAFPGAAVIDIDAPKHAHKEDIAKYVKARLLRESEPGQPTPYGGRERDATLVAKVVADRAYPNFLVARLVVEDLLLRPRPANPNSPADMAFPTKVAGAFDTYLARFGAREVVVRDLLLPLAYAEGQGLPWDNVWATVATALSERPYGDDDIQWVLTNAGAFVLETVENGRSAYRLYHQALADTLRRGRRMASVHARIARALVTSAPRAAAGAGAEWLLASAYVRAHLATHAAKGNTLGTLLNDPLYLLAADPAYLLPAIAFRRGAVPRDMVALYEAAVHHIRAQPPGTAASYLEMSARQRGLDAVARRIAALPMERAWRARWAHWAPQVPSRSLGKGPSAILVLVAAEWNNRSVALVGRFDGTVEVWDTGLGERLTRWKPPGVDITRAVALSDNTDDPLLIAGWESGHLAALHLDSGKEILVTDDAGVITMCLAERNTNRVCVSAHQDRRLVIRNLPDLTSLVEVPGATGGRIYGLRVVETGGGPALLSIGDSLCADEDELDRSMLRLWSLEDLSLLWEDGRKQRGVLHYSEPSYALGRSVIAISQFHYGPTQLWDIERRRLLLEGDAATSHAWVYTFRDEPLLIEVRLGGFTVRRLSAKGLDDNVTWQASEASDPLEIAGHPFSSAIRLHGRSVILSAAGDHVRVWDIEDLVARSLRSTTTADAASDKVAAVNVTSLAYVPATPDTVYVGTFGKILAIEAHSGRVRWERVLEPPSGPDDRINDLAPAPEGRLVAGTSSGIVHVIDPAASGAPAVLNTRASLIRVRAAWWKQQTVIFTTVGTPWSVRAWDLATGLEISTSSAYSLSFGEEDKTMQGLALHSSDETIRLAFASKYGKVMVADFTGPIHSFGRHYKEWRIPGTRGEYVSALTAGTADGDVLLAAGTEDGALAVWDFQTGMLIASRLAAHTNQISAVQVGAVGSSAVLATGGADEMLRLWTTTLNEITAIEVEQAISTLVWAGPSRLAVGSHRGLIVFDMASQCIPVSENLP